MSGTGDFTLARDGRGELVLVDSAGVEHRGVKPVRAFPISQPDQGVAIVGPDGAELAWIEDLPSAAEGVRRLVEEELARLEFMPVITRIVRIASHACPALWEVETDRGPTTLLLNDEDDIRPLGPGRAVITDAHGIRFLIADARKLDAPSRRALERYV